jgi:hypothetical protein
MPNLDILTDNPIFVRELRRRMRGKGLIITMILYIGAMCVFAYFIISSRSESLMRQYQAQSSGYYQQQYYGYPGAYQTVASIGRDLYNAIFFLQGLLVLVVAPTITAAMVKSEKERQTFDFLKVTTIRPWAYVVGALLSTFLYVALGLLCALPVVMLAYMYGGVSNVVQNTLILLAVSIVLSAAGLLVSCVQERKRTGQGIIVFAVVLILLFFVAGRFVIRWFTGFGQSAPPLPVLGWQVPVWLPVWGVASAVCAVLLIAAARKIFTPGERAFGYRQFGVIYLSVLGLLALAHLGSPAIWVSGFGNATLVSAFVILGIWMQNTMLLSRVENGNSRWRVQKRHPRLRGRRENAMYVAALTLAGALIVFASVNAVSSLGTVKVLFLFPALAFLVVHAGLCEMLLRTVDSEMRALQAVLAIDAIFLLVAPIAEISAPGSGSSTFVDLLVALSPINASIAVLQNSGTAPFAVLTAACIGAMGTFVWMAALRLPPRDTGEPISFEHAI